MTRWTPGARERLQQAALEAFLDEGFDDATVGGIAARAGLTERTFFRHFADKREVLFQGQELLSTGLVERVAAADGGTPWLAIAEDALTALGEFFSEDRREHSRRRQRAIDANTSLREREQLKLSVLARAVEDAFLARGTAPTVARLAGETTIALLKAAFAAWLADGETRAWPELVRDAVSELRAAR